MSSKQKPSSGDALSAISKFAFDAEEQIDDASQTQVDEILRKQGTDPTTLVKKMRQLIAQQSAELLSQEVNERKATILSFGTPVSFPPLSAMREAICNYGFAARLEDEMAEEDVQALYQQVQILRQMSDGGEQ
jgi:hypothetical protein